MRRWERWAKRLRPLVSRDAVEAELDEELAFHLEMETEKNLRLGMSPAEARRRARLAFGSVEGHREAVRDERWLGWVHGLSLDVKLGLRMLVKHPGLTLVAGVAIAVATGLGAAMFAFSEIYNPRWPFPEPDRLVAIQNWDMAKAAPERHSLHEVGIWQEESRTMANIGAVIQRELAVATEDRRSEVVEVAQISSAAFAIPRVPPLLGRPLQPEDEEPGAPAVVVIARDVWRRLFDGDPAALGQTVRLGAETATLVGVMPEGFRFPLNQEAWVPLPKELLTVAPGEGPPIRILGRLAPGASAAEAEAELAALARAATGGTERTGGGELRPRVQHLTEAFFGSGARWAVYGARVVFLLLMAVMCINVATLVFARAAMRGGEIAVRSAIGASRRRIVTQMFIEGLVLTAVPSLIGLAAAAWAVPRGIALFWRIQEMTPPFWADGRISLWSAAYVGGLAVFGAVVVGVIPALHATGRRLQPRLSESSSGSTLRFGGVWTVVIVVQVAVSVALLPFAAIEARAALRDAARVSGFPATHVLTSRLSHDPPVTPAAGTVSDDELRSSRALLLDEVRRRVEAEPGVAGVAFASRLSGMNHPVDFIELENAADSEPSRSLRRLEVDQTFFDLVGASLVAGRPLDPDDYASQTGRVLVNEEFAREITDGRNPVGMRFRYSGDAPEEARWYEIAGVVGDLEMDAFGPGVHRAVYHPFEPGGAATVQMFVRLTEPTPSAGPRLLSMVASLDPALQVTELLTLRDTWRPAHSGERLLAAIWAAIAAIALLLSMAGIHAMMSFAVSQRRREIGIRAAIGARPRQIVSSVFSRGLIQVGAGVLVGWLIASPVIWRDLSREGPAVLLIVGAVVLASGLLACFRPAVRALRIQPMEALKAAG